MFRASHRITARIPRDPFGERPVTVEFAFTLADALGTLDLIEARERAVWGEHNPCVRRYTRSVHSYDALENRVIYAVEPAHDDGEGLIAAE